MKNGCLNSDLICLLQSSEVRTILKIVVNPFPNDKFLDSSKVTQFADGSSNIDEIDRKFFLLLLYCFQKTRTADRLKPGLVWERLDWYQSLK